ncbi:hypothetical protein [Catellatospora tritici]|uniref:hypothetical protein n=1 Tax=Catellatospora tritici TaxID=2851566 RepID=UPI001C2D6268|nr:hypothetical protein [Catellatospora tritici]MBV1848824.1 hypothetical protein [Catellatospora tritici]
MKISTRRRVRRALGVAGLAAATLLAFSGFAQAEPEAAATIKACVHKKTGDVRIVELPKSGGTGCGKDERPVSWSAKGPRGPQGAPGTPGRPGPAGGPPLAFVDRNNGNLPDGSTTLLSLGNLPPGRYRLTASMQVGTDGRAPQLECRMFAGPSGVPLPAIGYIDEKDPQQGTAGQQYSSSGMTTAVVTVAQGDTVKVNCGGLGAFAGTLVALAVGPEAPAAP